jgi:glucan phosphoethanolaminetransferase (alkaline phosphatase superfamily)
MQPNDPNQASIDARYRAILILWAAISMSIMSFLFVINLVPAQTAPNSRLSLALNLAGIAPVALSFILKIKLLQQSIEMNRIELVQIAYVLAVALCEMSALLGLMDHFLTGSNYYPVGFAFGLLGILLHFPQKKYLLAASGQEF